MTFKWRNLLVSAMSSCLASKDFASISCSVWRSFLLLQIANYIPSDEDLDYPAKLEGSPNTISETDLGVEWNSQISSMVLVIFSCSLYTYILSLQDDENADVFKTWYPPLEKTLSCLSKLYRCLEPAVFTGLAQARLSVTLLLPFCQKIPVHV